MPSQIKVSTFVLPLILFFFSYRTLSPIWSGQIRPSLWNVYVLLAGFTVNDSKCILHSSAVCVSAYVFIRNWNGGRSIVIDFIAYCPEENKIYIIEPQCYWQKNIYCRNRYYGSMVDADSLQVGQDFSEMPKRCMIVLTEKDFNSKDPMIQHIKKVDLMSGNTVESGEEEIIVNLAAETDDSELGQFIRDWTNPNPDDIKNPVFAEALRYYKFNPKGVDKMYSMLEETRREADLKYIGILLNHGLSVEEIAKETELDEAYVKEIKSEIDSKKESN